MLDGEPVVLKDRISNLLADAPLEQLRAAAANWSRRRVMVGSEIQQQGVNERNNRDVVIRGASLRVGLRSVNECEGRDGHQVKNVGVGLKVNQD